MTKKDTKVFLGLLTEAKDRLCENPFDSLVEVHDSIDAAFSQADIIYALSELGGTDTLREIISAPEELIIFKHKEGNEKLVCAFIVLLRRNTSMQAIQDRLIEMFA
jgi:hypothetical protein